MAPPTPTVKSFLLADHVFRQDNGKWCLIGVFSAVFAKSFPVLHHSLGLFLRLADADGRYDVRVEIRDAESRMITKLSGITMEVKNRLAEVDIGLQGKNLVIPAPGTYFLKVFFNDQDSGADIRLEAIREDESQ